LLFCVCIISDVTKFRYIGRINFFVLPVEEILRLKTTKKKHASSMMTYAATNIQAVPTNCNFAL